MLPIPWCPTRMSARECAASTEYYKVIVCYGMLYATAKNNFERNTVKLSPEWLAFFSFFLGRRREMWGTVSAFANEPYKARLSTDS